MMLPYSLNVISQNYAIVKRTEPTASFVQVRNNTTERTGGAGALPAARPVARGGCTRKMHF
jgi:hypothetical protein